LLKTSHRSGLLKIWKQSLRILALSRVSRFSHSTRVQEWHVLLLSASNRLIMQLRLELDFITTALKITSSLSQTMSFLRLGKNSSLR
jgi:hypothetical protein